MGKMKNVKVKNVNLGIENAEREEQIELVQTIYSLDNILKLIEEKHDGKFTTLYVLNGVCGDRDIDSFSAWIGEVNENGKTIRTLEVNDDSLDDELNNRLFYIKESEILCCKHDNLTENTFIFLANQTIQLYSMN